MTEATVSRIMDQCDGMGVSPDKSRVVAAVLLGKVISELPIVFRHIDVCLSPCKQIQTFLFEKRYSKCKNKYTCHERS
jgi:hypothetical protein